MCVCHNKTWIYEKVVPPDPGRNSSCVGTPPLVVWVSRCVTIYDSPKCLPSWYKPWGRKYYSSHPLSRSPLERRIGIHSYEVRTDGTFGSFLTNHCMTRNTHVIVAPTLFIYIYICIVIQFEKARAIENQCYVIAAAQCGRHNDQRSSYGHSLVVDGWGTVLVDAGGMDQPLSTTTAPTITTCDIDLSTIESIRERMPIQQHRANSHFSTDRETRK